MRRSVLRLEKLAQLSRDEFLQDPDHYAIAEHYLRRAIEAALDASRHIIAKEGWGRPSEYRDVLDILGTRGILPAEFARRIRNMAGYRNRLVHLYAEVTADEIYQIVTGYLGDLTEYARHLLIWLDGVRR